jgi:predicted transcriptional regulator
MGEPIKTTVYLDPEDYRRLKVLAREQGRTTASLVREAVSAYARSQPLPVRPASIGVARSGRRDLADQAEALLRGMGEHT